MVTAGRPHYGPLIDMDFEQTRRALDEHMLLMIQVARNTSKVRPGNTLLFMGGAGGAVQASAAGSRRPLPPHSPLSQPTWRSSSRPSEST